MVKQANHIHDCTLLAVYPVPHHMSGVRADSILAINKDPNAPIYEYADYGICGDIYEVLPKLIDSAAKVC